MYYVSRAAAATVLLGLAAAAVFAIRLALADANFRRGTDDSVARAVDLMPRNTEYLLFRVLQLEYKGQDATPLLRSIAAIAPLASSPRIRLGLAAEVRGDFDLAEKWLLEAARIDRQFEPRWTLANYYFRRGKADEFWKWMRSALEMSYGDRRPAFELCWRETDDPEVILTRAIPDRREVRAAYLEYLMGERSLAAAVPVALKLAAAGDVRDRPLLFAACDTLLAAGDGHSARALWGAMGYSAGIGIPRESFERQPTGHGFDWRPLEVAGVQQSMRGAYRITLSGRQPESCELLLRSVSLQPGTRYVLRWEARAKGSIAGLEWRIAGQRAALLPSGELTFTASSDLSVLALAYQRPQGQPRAEGAVELIGVSIEEAK